MVLGGMSGMGAGPETCCAFRKTAATGPDKRAPTMKPGRVHYAYGNARRYRVMSF